MMMVIRAKQQSKDTRNTYPSVNQTGGGFFDDSDDDDDD